MTHPGSFSATSESLADSGCYPLRMGADSKKGCASYLLSIRPRYDAVFAAGEGHALYWASKTQAGVLLRPKMPLARRATWPENLLAIQIFNWPDYFSISRPLRM